MAAASYKLLDGAGYEVCFTRRVIYIDHGYLSSGFYPLLGRNSLSLLILPDDSTSRPGN
jgi:hypothetical protein